MCYYKYNFNINQIEFRMNTLFRFTVILLIVAFTSALAYAKPLGERIVLDNGVVLLYSYQPALPIVSYNIIIDSGSIRESENKAGLSDITANLLTEGAGGLSSQQIAEKIEFVGGSISSIGGREYISVGLNVLSKDLPLGLDLLYKVLRQPDFPQSELDRIKKQTIGAIDAKQDDPSSLAQDAFLESVYTKANGYGRPVEGYKETIADISRDDVIKFYKENYCPDRMIIAVVGDINREDAVNSIKKLTKNWNNLPKSDIKVSKISNVNKNIIINKKLTQANILYGSLGIERGNSDYYKALTMNYILGGGGFTSRLMDIIRDNNGLAYDVHSYFMPSKYTGIFIAGLQTRKDSADRAVKLLKDEIKRIKSTSVTDNELNAAKAYLIGSFPLKIDTNAKISNMLVQLEFYNLGLDYPDRYPAIIKAITKDDIKAAANKYLPTENNAIEVIVGEFNHETIDSGNKSK